MHGSGLIKYNDGSSYNGQFRIGRKEGNGIYT